MNKLVLMIVLFAMSASIATAQQKETRSFGDFHSVYFFGNIEVMMIKSDSNYAEMIGENIELGSITSQLKDGQLIIKNTAVTGSKKLIVTFHYKSIDELIAKAGVKVKSKNTFDAANFSLRLSKGAEAQIVVDNKSLEAVIIQGGELIITGKVDRLDVTCNAGAVFYGFNLMSKDALLRAVTGGKIEIKIRGKLEASTNTGGMIYYKGTPTIISQKSVTGGIIEKKN